MVPFLGLFRRTSQLLLTSTSSPNISVVAQAMVLLIDIFYDLTCQDLPPAIEDSYNEFFGKDIGLFFRFLTWDPVELKSDVR
jgi:exportin-2 (importin alpha re-exporter)